MCEAKPGPRCSSDTCREASSTRATYDTAHANGPSVNALTEARTAPLPDPAVTYLNVGVEVCPDSDDHPWGGTVSVNHFGTGLHQKIGQRLDSNYRRVPHMVPVGALRDRAKYVPLPDVTPWRVEFVNDEAQGARVWARRDDISALVRQHSADRYNPRLKVTEHADGSWTISEYDYGRWTATLPPPSDV